MVVRVITQGLKSVHLQPTPGNLSDLYCEPLQITRGYRSRLSRMKKLKPHRRSRLVSRMIMFYVCVRDLPNFAFAISAFHETSLARAAFISGCRYLAAASFFATSVAAFFSFVIHLASFFARFCSGNTRQISYSGHSPNNPPFFF